MGEKCKIILQVVNASPTATTVYKGTKLETFTPIGQVQLISNVQESHCETKAPLQIDLTTTELSQTEQRELLELLNSFSTLFVGDGEPVGRTGVVKHDIETSGAPIRQPVRRLPQSMKHIVEDEVEKMLQQGIILTQYQPMVIHYCYGAQEEWVMEVLH